MSHLDHPPPPARRLLLPALLGALALLCVVVLRPFIVPLVWAALLAYTSWPVYRRVQRICRGRATPAALAMTTVVAVVLIGPLLALAIVLRSELADLHQALLAYRSEAAPLPPLLGAFPWLAEWITQLLDRYAGDPLVVRQLVLDWAQNSRAELLSIVGSVSRNAAKLLVTIITVFFFYRDGESLVRQSAQVVARFFNDRLDRYVRAAATMVRAVVFGLLVTALVQGSVAGVGYAIVGVDAPAFLGALTALASIVPVVGTGLVWGVVAAGLLLTGHSWPGLALIAWCTVLVHPVDNLVRPLLISNATHLPFLLIMFGIIGGLAAFGLVGIFVGPVALAVATAVWREWLEEHGTGTASGAGS